jgi:hypothetical protein
VDNHDAADETSKSPITHGPSGFVYDVRMFARAVRNVGLPTMIKAGGQLKHDYRQQDSDEDSPRSVSLNDRASRIVNLAGALAEAGREDEEAVAQIRQAAGGHLDDLKMASLAARQGGLHHESLTQNRIHRLLQAALLNGPVGPPADEDRLLLERVAKFEAATDAAKWLELVGLEPRLAELENDVVTGSLSVPHRGTRDRAARDEALREQRLVQIRIYYDRIDGLVGPKAECDDPLLRTESANSLVHGHLRSLGEVDRSG